MRRWLVSLGASKLPQTSSFSGDLVLLRALVRLNSNKWSVSDVLQLLAETATQCFKEATLLPPPELSSLPLAW